jgi:hypothetical protein
VVFKVGVLTTTSSITGYYGLNYVSQKVAEAIATRTSECDLIWKWGLYRDKQDDMRSLEWMLVNVPGVFIKRGNCMEGE